MGLSWVKSPKKWVWDERNRRWDESWVKKCEKWVLWNCRETKRVNGGENKIKGEGNWKYFHFEATAQMLELFRSNHQNYLYYLIFVFFHLRCTIALKHIIIIKMFFWTIQPYGCRGKAILLTIKNSRNF